MSTPKRIAQWMLDQINQDEELLQVEAVAKIEQLFGSEFVYVNTNGEMSIDKRVLNQFRKRTENNVVWVTSHGGGYWPEAHWRKRGPGDSPERTQYVYQ